MEVKHGYKQTEVGVIPDDWKTVTYSDHMNIMAGLGFKKSEYRDAGIRLLRIDNVSYGQITWDSVAYLPKKYSHKFPHLVLAEGDILLALNRPITNGQLKMARIRGEDLPAILYQRVGRISFINNQINKGFAYHILRKFIRKFVEDSSVGSDQPFVSTTALKKTLLPIPPTIGEQEAIAEALSDADALIESLEQLLAKKRRIKQGAMQELLTGKKRLPGFQVKPGYKQTEVGMIPEDWEAVDLSNICSMKSGEGITSARIDDFSPYPCYGGNGLRGFTTRYTHDGTFALIGRQGALCGNVVGVKGKFFASEHAVVVSTKQNIDILWLTYILGTMHLNRYSESSAQPGLSVSKVMKLQLAFPKKFTEQAAIAEVLSSMDEELIMLESKLSKARQIKQGMMQELLTGRIRLI
jgi:type I restriction enzyme S subunit